jgi:hypothetical protein
MQLIKRKQLGVKTKKLGNPPSVPTWPSYTGVSTYIGSSNIGAVHVFVDSSLGNDGTQNAIDLVNDVDRIVAMNDNFFETTHGEVSVIVFALGGMTDGTGGADHMGCDYTTGNAIEVCASFGNSMRVSGLFEAELSECNMGGNLCGVSTGESLSRWCANVISNGALSDFATAPTWYQDGMPNFVDNIAQTDTDADSIGCGMTFISWLINQGHTLSDIAQEMVKLGEGGLFCMLYGNLTGDDPGNAWSKFKNDVNNLVFGVFNDDPFGQARSMFVSLKNKG